MPLSLAEPTSESDEVPVSLDVVVPSTDVDCKFDAESVVIIVDSRGLFNIKLEEMVNRKPEPSVPTLTVALVIVIVVIRILLLLPSDFGRDVDVETS